MLPLWLLNILHASYAVVIVPGWNITSGINSWQWGFLFHCLTVINCTWADCCMITYRTVFYNVSPTLSLISCIQYINTQKSDCVLSVDISNWMLFLSCRHTLHPPTVPLQAPRKSSLLSTPACLSQFLCIVVSWFLCRKHPDLIKKKWYIVPNKSVKWLIKCLTILGGQHHPCSNVNLRMISAWQTRQSENIKSQSAQCLMQCLLATLSPLQHLTVLQPAKCIMSMAGWIRVTTSCRTASYAFQVKLKS